jgi:protein translocase SEC61 complex gamma subunit
MTKDRDIEFFDTKNYISVLRSSNTPSLTEFKRVTSIAGAGIIILGLAGFIISFAMSFIPFL